MAFATLAFATRAQLASASVSGTPSFGEGGIVHAPAGTTDVAKPSQCADGDLVVPWRVGGRLVVAKYGPNGVPRTDFSSDGMIDLNAPDESDDSEDFYTDPYFYVTSVTCLNDGAIALGGSYRVGYEWIPALAKLGSDGEFTDLGDALGNTVKTFPDVVGYESVNQVDRLVTTDSGDIVAQAAMWWGTGSGAGALIKVDSDLNTVTDFGGDGVVYTDLPSGLTTGPDDSVKVSAYAGSVRAYYSSTILAAYDKHGAPLASFGPDGNGVFDVYDNHGSAVQGAGGFYEDGFVIVSFRVRKPHGGGDLVSMSAYGFDGRSEQPLNGDFFADRDWLALAGEHMPDGKYLRAGDKFLRSNADGSPDETFGPHGEADFAPFKNFRVRDLVPRKDGKIWVIGGSPFDVPYTNADVGDYVLTLVSLRDDCGGSCAGSVDDLSKSGPLTAPKVTGPLKAVRSRKLKRIVGTSSGATTVQLALVRYGVGPQRLSWVNASGSDNWAYRLPKKLKPGRWGVYVRGVGASGLFSPRTLKHFTVKR